MSYIFAIIAAVSFASGYGVSHQIDKSALVSMESSINAQKAKAQATLSIAISRVDAAQAKAKEANNNLDKAHEQDIKTINAYRDLLAAARLSDPGRRTSGRGSLSNSDHSGIVKDESGTRELSAELTRFLQVKFYAADKVAEYARQCYTFVVEQNCGIAK